MDGLGHSNWVDIFQVLSSYHSIFLLNLLFFHLIEPLCQNTHFSLQPELIGQSLHEEIHITVYICNLWFHSRKHLPYMIMRIIHKFFNHGQGFMTFVLANLNPLQISKINAKNIAYVPISSINRCRYSTRQFVTKNYNYN